MRLRRWIGAVCVVSACVASVSAQPEPGWTFYTPMTGTDTELMRLDGSIAHTWPSAYLPGQSVYLEGDGRILRTAQSFGLPGPAGAGAGGIIQVIDWDGNVEWEMQLATADFRQHHDIERLPNGNILAILWQRYTFDEAVAAGRDPAMTPSEVWSERIVEIMPTGPTSGEIVWEWDAWDHLVQDFDPSKPNFGNPVDHPGRIDVNLTPRGAFDFDWLHFNAIDYNPELDQILLSNNAWSEIWVISRAAGSSGEILYRWGNPAAWGAGLASDQTLFGQHDAQWIDEDLPGGGNILIYNNGRGRPAGAFSSMDEIVPPVLPDGTYLGGVGMGYGPSSPVWTCDNAGGSQFYSPIVSGAQRLPNGNTLACVGQPGNFLEVDEDCNLEWEESIGTLVFRATRVGERDPRLRGRAWCAADVGLPYGTVDFNDVVAYLTAFGAGEELADYAEPFGVLDFNDVIGYLAAFAAGCP